MLPLVALTKPNSARPSVDLPDPDSPTRPSTSPGASESDTPSTARTVPDERPISRAIAFVRNAKWTFRSVISTIGASAVGVVVPAPVDSGLISYRNLLPFEWCAVGVRQRRVVQPALGAVCGELRRLLRGANLHRVFASWMEPTT